MAQKNWNLDQLKSELAKREKSDGVTGWILTQEHAHRRERYFMADGSSLAVDQDRDVHARNIQLRLFVDIGKAGRQGEISKKVFPSLDLSRQIENAIDAARQTDHQAWHLPRQAASSRRAEPATLITIPTVATTDPGMAEDLEGALAEKTREINKAVARKREASFNSAELFLSVHDFELHLSNGLTHRSSQSRVYAEAAYSSTKTGPAGSRLSDEYLSARWAVTPAELSIEKLFEETSDRALRSLDVAKPETGKYPVIIDADVLATLFNNQLSQLSSSNTYHGLPFVKPGDDLVAGAEGDLITLTLDPSLDYGADTTALSEQGLVQTPFRLVAQNKVVATSTDQRYSDYLGAPVTTVRGNVVVEPGTMSHEQLTRQAPKVIEILQFSGLFADPNSGTFSSEIRLAKLYDNETGKVSYLKGGSLSGSIAENFKRARFSRDRVRRAQFSSNSVVGEGYFGPEHALLSDVSIVG